MIRYYDCKLKLNARNLRSNSTDAEIKLWSRLRRKQLLNIQFYRQKSLGKYIVDFYAPLPKLVIEADGSQHLEENYLQLDKERDAYLVSQGLKILRFNNLQILKSIDEVMEIIFHTVEVSCNPPLLKRERGS